MDNDYGTQPPPSTGPTTTVGVPRDFPLAQTGSDVYPTVGIAAALLVAGALALWGARLRSLGRRRSLRQLP